MIPHSRIQSYFTWPVSDIPRVRDTKDASQAVGVLKLSLKYTGGAQQATPQLNRVRMTYYVEVYGTTEKLVSS